MKKSLGANLCLKLERAWHQSMPNEQTMQRSNGQTERGGMARRRTAESEMKE